MNQPTSDHASIRAVSTEVLLSELTRRQPSSRDADTKPACGSGERGAYNMPLHVFALFLILIVSTTACAFPLLSRKSKTRIQSRIIFLCQHFGTGVLLATAFVHLLPTAFESLTDPCLPDFFNKGYPAMAGLISLLAALTVVTIESYLTIRGAGHSHAHSKWEDDEESSDSAHHRSHSTRKNRREGSMGSSHTDHHHRHNLSRDDIGLDDIEATRGLMSEESPSALATPHQPDQHFLPEEENQANPFRDSREAHRRISSVQEDDLPISHDELAGASLHSSHATSHAPSTQTNFNSEEYQRQLLQCLLLEAGILFHSVFIGMAVSVSTGPSFIIFLIAISFHQCFEGLALGSRIAAITFPARSPRPWLMVLAFGAVTPVGQAIGLSVHSLYDPQSEMGLLLVGTMNAISSGLLLFAGLVQLLAEDFLSRESYQRLHGKKRIQAFAAVVCGVLLMALVGAFA